MLVLREYSSKAAAAASFTSLLTPRLKPSNMVPDIARLGANSPEAVKVEKDLLDASASTEHVGRRPSTSSGRDAKRISESRPFIAVRYPSQLHGHCCGHGRGHAWRCLHFRWLDWYRELRLCRSSGWKMDSISCLVCTSLDDDDAHIPLSKSGPLSKNNITSTHTNHLHLHLHRYVLPYLSLG